MMDERTLQLTDVACCGIRRVDEDGCCVICGRDFYDPETGAEVGDGTRIPNECVRDASLDMLEALEGLAAHCREWCGTLHYEMVWAAEIAIAKAKNLT